MYFMLKGKEFITIKQAEDNLVYTQSLPIQGINLLINRDVLSVNDGTSERNEISPRL